MNIQKTYYPENRKEWRKWLSINHSKANDIWVIYYKKHTNKSRVPYNDAVEEALCFGWIDSTVKRLDNERYCQRFTPRNEKSHWSESNKKRADKLIKNKSMTKYGLAKINAAKKNGMWDAIITPTKEFEFPNEFLIELDSNKKAKINFEALSYSYKKQYINWIASAKKSETRIRRSTKAIALLENNQKLGIK